MVFEPEKIRRYLLYGFFLYLFYIFTGRLYALIPSLLCLCLAIVSRYRQFQYRAL